jgi:hypothetical protein
VKVLGVLFRPRLLKALRDLAFVLLDLVPDAFLVPTLRKELSDGAVLPDFVFGDHQYSFRLPAVGGDEFTVPILRCLGFRHVADTEPPSPRIVAFRLDVRLDLEIPELRLEDGLDVQRIAAKKKVKVEAVTSTGYLAYPQGNNALILQVAGNFRPQGFQFVGRNVLGDVQRDEVGELGLE